MATLPRTPDLGSTGSRHTLAVAVLPLYCGLSRTYTQTEVAACADGIAVYSYSLNPKKATRLVEAAAQDISARLQQITIHTNPSKTIHCFQRETIQDSYIHTKQ